ncbi:hypothetical protein [Streptomyces sp. NBC_00893]|uniref:hypothetical protein n=1 Tax=Streptomyces sp. NBC_00893 TaxID=2975862 RepID=UPI002258D209|nr:hypothetical protein [Streptomyces sp. NBC_00893]MCX4849444.1 hypothetical protein [Streptomyces sp. NBC_00893]
MTCGLDWLSNGSEADHRNAISRRPLGHLYFSERRGRVSGLRDASDDTVLGHSPYLVLGQSDSLGTFGIEAGGQEHVQLRRQGLLGRSAGFNTSNC